jgi:hypothetical protein
MWDKTKHPQWNRKEFHWKCCWWLIFFCQFIVKDVVCRRELRQVITPGSVVDEGLLNDSRATFLLSITVSPCFFVHFVLLFVLVLVLLLFLYLFSSWKAVLLLFRKIQRITHTEFVMWIVLQQSLHLDIFKYCTLFCFVLFCCDFFSDYFLLLLSSFWLGFILIVSSYTHIH